MAALAPLQLEAYEPRQARKGAAVIGQGCAEVTLELPHLHLCTHIDSFMKQESLARKWRPQSFAAVVGQEHIVAALRYYLKQHNTHPATLFSGTRGVGKTTLARLLAKALNCEIAIAAEPCNACNSCLNIQQACSPDVMEIDGASRAKVEDIRGVLDAAQYAPVQSRYKVFIIDEVHMLSQHSFNALLKTLEEPPEHVRFILATTEAEKIPETVLSRCLHFHLNTVSPQALSEHLRHVCKEQKISFDQEAMGLLVQNARGSIRDALTLLEQAIAVGEGRLQNFKMAQWLGETLQSDVIRLCEAIQSNAIDTVLTLVRDLIRNGARPQNLLNQLIRHMYHSIVQMLEIRTQQPNTSEKDFASRIEQLQMWYQIGILSQRDWKHHPNETMALEMTLIRMTTFVPQNIQPAGTTTPSPAQNLPITESQRAPHAVVAPTAASTVVLKEAALSAAAPQSNEHTASTESAEEGFPLWLRNLPATGLAAQLLQHCTLKSISDAKIELRLNPEHAALSNNLTVNKLSELIKNATGKKLALQIHLEVHQGATLATEAAKMRDEKQSQRKAQVFTEPGIANFVQKFDAKLLAVKDAD